MYNCNVLSFFSLKTKNLKTAWYETRCPTTVRKWYYQSTHLCVFGDPAWLWKAEEHSSNCIWAVKLAAEAGKLMLFFKIKYKNDMVQIRHTYLIQVGLPYSCVIGVVVVFMEMCEKLFIHKHYIREAQGRGFYCENASRNPYIYIVAILIKVFTLGKSAASRPLAGECLRKAVWTQRRETYWADDMYSVRGIFLTLCLAPAVSVFTLTACLLGCCFFFLKKSHDELFLLSNNQLKSL